MPISTDEIELHTAALKKFKAEHPQTLDWLLHNFAVIKAGMDTGATEVDLTTLQAEIDAAEALIAVLQASLAALQAQVDALGAPADVAALEAAIAALQAAVINLQAQINNLPPPFVMPDGTDGQILTHGPGGNSDIFFADQEDVVTTTYAPAQTGDLIPVNEETEDEAILPEFVLSPEGQVMLIPVS